jgi:hypothetical protein
MEYLQTLEKFLDGVRKIRAGVYALNGVYLLLTLLIGTYIAGNSIAYFFSHAQSIVLAFIYLSIIPLAAIFYNYFIRGAFSGFSQDQAALLVEAKYPNLNNALINSSQLQRYLQDPAGDRKVSLDFVRELIQRTISQIQGIHTESVIDQTELTRNRNLFLGVSGLLIILSLTLPDFLARGFDNFISKPKTAPILSVKADKTAEAPAVSTLPPPVYTVQSIWYGCTKIQLIPVLGK